MEHFGHNRCAACARRYADRVQFIGIAVESEEAAVRELLGEARITFPNVMGSPELSQQFGDVLSVPTLFVFAADGKTAAVFYGAPPGLHDAVGKVLQRLTSGEGK